MPCISMSVVELYYVILAGFVYVFKELVMDFKMEFTCGAGLMKLLISRTDNNHMRRFYKCPLRKVCNCVLNIYVMIIS
jgi:hypothetical protein